jgi:4-diphosphocytidyl-2-C-methyl-D-erythritol kinase
MLPIALFDALVFRARDNSAIELDCRWAGAERDKTLGVLPPPQDNLVTRALEMLRSAAGISQGARVQVLKGIPSAAGLGGGSSDAAAALAAANVGWGLNLPTSELAALAAQLGSDVPFFLASSPAVCRGRGEKIETTEGLGALHFVVVRPPEGLSTAKVYAHCRPAAAPRSSAALVAALRSGDMRAAARLLHNQLQPAAEELSPWVPRMKQEFARLDCLAAQMSGSGTGYFGLCRSARHARRVAGYLHSRGVGHVYAVSSN